MIPEKETKPNKLEAGDSSPPRPAIPPPLSDELAAIIADALVADVTNTH